MAAELTREQRLERALRDLIADDAYVCTFQTFGQYRTALLKAIDASGVKGPDHA